MYLSYLNYRNSQLDQLCLRSRTPVLQVEVGGDLWKCFSQTKGKHIREDSLGQMLDRMDLGLAEATGGITVDFSGSGF